jgi:two-component system cell cycle response regulator
MACVAAERIRQDVEGHSFQLGDMNIAITVSIGVAVMMPTHADKEALIHDADSALYYAKNAGRNRVSFPRKIVSEG